MSSFKTNLSGPAGDRKKKGLNRLITWLFLIAAGALMGYVIVSGCEINGMPYGTPLEEEYMSLRVDWLNAFIREFRETGLYTGLHRLYDHDAAMYLYLSRLGKFLGSDAVGTFHFMQAFATFLWISAMPVLWYRATGSFSRAAASSLFFVFFCPYSVFFPNDSCWAGSMMTFVGLPILYFLFKEKMSRQNFVWAFFLAVLSGFANAFRSHVGLGVSFLLIVLALVKLAWPAFKEKSKIRAAGAAGLVLAVALSYSLFTNYIPRAYQKITGQPEPLPIKGPWHTMYIGLGWEENPLGIEYSDSVGYKGREELLYDITKGYYIGIESPQYIKQMKVEWIKAVKENFDFFFPSYIRKFFRTFKTIWDNSVINPHILKDAWFYSNTFALYLYILCMGVSTVEILKAIKRRNKDNIISIKTAIFIGFVLCILGVLQGMVSVPYSRSHIYGAVAVADCVVLARMVLTRKTAESYIVNFLKNRRRKDKTGRM